MKYLKDSQIKLSNCKPLRWLSRSLVLLEGFPVLRAKDPKVRRARVCMTVAGLVLQGITGG